MRSPFLLTALLSIGQLHCSADGDEGSVGRGPTNNGTASSPDGVPVAPPPPGQANPGADDAIIGDDGAPGDQPVPVDPNGVPQNIGTELLCDGIDENANGIIDDVDKGKDGLCDCLNIGVVGDFASNAGNQTNAFETWLESRSDVPVTHIPATATITEALLAPLQVLIIGNMTPRVNSQGMSTFSSAEIAVVKAWVEERGGGLMTLAGYTAVESHMDPTAELLDFTGLGYDYEGQGAGVLGMGAPPITVSGIASPNHPTVDGVAAVGVYYAYPVIGDGEVILEKDGTTLAMAKQLANGRVFAFSDEWITQDRLWGEGPPPPLTQCQQQCMQCQGQCTQCEGACLACSMEPCSDPGAVDPCSRGCDNGCESCTSQCDTCTAACEVCSAAEPGLDVPRFWLNVLSWLTPANECQVPIPPDIPTVR